MILLSEVVICVIVFTSLRQEVDCLILLRSYEIVSRDEKSTQLFRGLSYKICNLRKEMW
jgi:hypothetical protein